MDFENLVTVTQLAEMNPAFSEATIRWWIFNADHNGFNVCLVRVGGRVYIDLVKFNGWLDEHRVEAEAL